MSLPSLHRLSLATGSVLQTSQTSERIRVSLMEILERRVERFRESVLASATEASAALETERVFLRDVLLEYTTQRAFDVACLHPPLALYVDEKAMNQLLAFLKRAQTRIDPSNVFLREPLEEFVEELNEEADLANALLKRLEAVWTRLHDTSQSFQQWAETFDDALSPLWSECRTGFNVKMFNGPRDYAKQLKHWWASEVGKKEWTPDESQEDEDDEEEEGGGDDEDEDSQESEQGMDVEKNTTNLCPNVYAYGLYSGAFKRDTPLTYEHIISKSWCNTTESILELEHCIEDASLLALATKSRNVSRLNNLLPLLLRDKYRRSLSVRGLWKPLPMRGFSLPRRAVAARITARGFLAYPFLQPPIRSYEDMEESIIELTQSPHFSTQTQTSERWRCAEWEIGLALLLWRELGVPFNVFTLFAHTATPDAVVDLWRPRFDALLRLRLQEHDAFRALLLAHAPTLRIRQSLRGNRRDYDGSPRVTVRAADEDDDEDGDDDDEDGDDEDGNDDERGKKQRLGLNTPKPTQYLTIEQIREAFRNKSTIEFLDNNEDRWKDGTVIQDGKRVQGSDGTVLVSNLKVSKKKDRYKIVLKV